MSTIDMINMLHPDVVALGNHEVDYGLAHLLFLEKCAYFPIVISRIAKGASPSTPSRVGLSSPGTISKRGGFRAPDGDSAGS